MRQLLLMAAALPLMFCEPNTLVYLERQQGYRLLFDGGSLDGWTNPGNWEVVDGSIYRARGGGSLVQTAVTLPDNFELRFEWRVAAGSNSGVYYRPGQHEYQILDNRGHPDGRSPLTSAAALYALVPAVPDATRPVGEWNEGRVVCQGTRIEHWLNGVKVVDLDSADPANAAAVQAFQRRFGTDMNARGGHLSFQDHGDPVWYRTIRLRTIP